MTRLPQASQLPVAVATRSDMPMSGSHFPFAPLFAEP